MKKNPKNSFVLYLDYYEQISLLNKNQKADLLDKIFQYVRLDQNQIELDGMTNMVFLFIKQQLKRDLSKWKTTCENRAIAGSLGGKAKAAKTNKSSKRSKASKCQKSLANVANVAEYEYENEYEYVNENEDEDVKKNNAVFSKPSLCVLEEYIKEKGYDFSAEAFYNYYESVGWKVGKNKMKSWKAACVTWQSRVKFDSKEQTPDEKNQVLERLLS